MRSRSRHQAQTVTEYMMVISVIVIALVSVVRLTMFPVLEQGSSQFRTNQAKASKDGYVGTGHNGERR